MSQLTSYATHSVDIPRAALSGVRTRRMFAILLDLIVVGFLSLAIWFVLLIGTFGLALLLLPPIFPLVAFFYNGLSMSSRSGATPGMRACDLEARLMDGARVPFINAAVHALLYYVSVTILTPAILAVSIFAPEKRCLHDMLSGIVIVRRIND